MKNKITNKNFLKLMIPFILSTITQPLLGAVDIAVVGHLNNDKYISGVALGTLIFNTIYWIFGFLRVSTTGYSAQSSHLKDREDVSSIFFRPILVAIVISFVMLLSQKIIFSTSMLYLSKDVEIVKNARIYFDILIWGAPFVLINYTILGWLMGLGNIKGSLTMQISGNIFNIILDIIFVTVLKWNVEGVAVATLISQILSTMIGIYHIYPYKYGKYFNLKKVLNYQEILKMLSNNRDLMIRTICLVWHNNLFMSGGSMLGNEILAGNSILFQIMSILSYSFDGVANTSSVFSGRAKGKKDDELMRATWKKTLQWGGILVVFLTLLITVFRYEVIGIFTNLDNIKVIAYKYCIWIVIYPVVAFLGLTFYGVFTGSGTTFPIMLSTVEAFILFFISRKYLINNFENNGVWLSLLIFYFFRGALLLPHLKKTLYKR